jgi:hypothetical protein
VTDFDPVAHMLANPRRASGYASRFDEPRPKAWLEKIVDAYEARTIESWNWAWVSQSLRAGDPTLPKESALREYVRTHRQDLEERIAKVR